MGMTIGNTLAVLTTGAPGGGRDVRPVLLVVGVLIILVLLLGVVAVLARRWFLGQEPGAELDASGVLESMRAMRDRGELSEEEYRSAQAAIVAKASASTAGHAEADTRAPARARTRPPLPGEVRAEPGFDLTGAPLPSAARRKEQGGSAGSA